MKKIIFGAMTSVMLVSCGASAQKTEVDVNAAIEAFKEWNTAFMTEYRTEGANRDSLEAVYMDYTQKLAEDHIGDSLGLMLTIEAAYEMNKQELDSAMNLCEMYKNNERMIRLSKAIESQEKTGVGCTYIDVEGVDATTGNALKLSDIVAQGKPVVVDFWASWCGPCRAEIKNALSAYAPKYADKVSFVGIAVWENNISDTQKAMSELPITWPILFAGGRENSPSEQYGIMGIPHIMLIGADGVIKARNLRGAQIESAILSEIGQK